MDKTFAAEYPINEDGLFRFPNDVNYRQSLFPSLVLSDHPAKANVFLVQAIVEFVSEPGETIMDIMAGTGTIMTAALIGRRVVCLDIEEEYIEILEQGAESLEAIALGIKDMITIVQGDCAKLLPLPIADHIIFSPPYAQIMKSKGKDKLTVEKLGEGVAKYSKHPDNISNLNEFLYHQKMELIYKKAFESLPPGGTLTIIIKDHVKNGKRVFLGERAERDCVRMGFESVGHYKHEALGTAYTKIYRARGDLTVEDEDIIILRRQ